MIPYNIISYHIVFNWALEFNKSSCIGAHSCIFFIWLLHSITTLNYKSPSPSLLHFCDCSRYLHISPFIGFIAFFFSPFFLYLSYNASCYVHNKVQNTVFFFLNFFLLCVVCTYRNNKVPLYLAVNKCESETQGIAQAQVFFIFP